mgnify:CR=1 FL=1
MTPRPKRKNTTRPVAQGSAPIPFPTGGLVRLARVASAQRRVAAGWYDRAEVRDSLVDAVMQEFRGH